LDEAAHSIFAIKYWVLSRKISQLVKGNEDLRLDCKSRTIFAFQMFLILSTGIAYALTDSYQFKNVTILLAVLTLAPYIAFALLGEALWKLTRCGSEHLQLSSL
jgi:hypothetical protein